jgi:hypothetical protein
MSRMDLYLTIAPPGECRTLEQALHLWNTGEPWRIYRGAGVRCTSNDVLRLRMSGFTHVVLVWQDTDLAVHGHEIELK